MMYFKLRRKGNMQRVEKVGGCSGGSRYMQRAAIYLGCQSVRQFDIIAVLGNLEPKFFGDINRSCRARLVLQTAQIRLYFSSIDFDFRLVGKGNILLAMVVTRTKYHHSRRWF